MQNLSLLVALALAAAGCESMQSMDAWHSVTRAVAVMHPTQGSETHGIVTFEQTDAGIKVIADIHGLAPNSTHGFHIHTYGDCSKPDGTSAGGHYNPEGHQHALPDGGPRHAGDLGNLKSDANGDAHYEFLATNITLVGDLNPILGRGVIIHAKPDDGGQPTGNAGARIACGVIGIANPGE
ncbi:MAG: superoxide dismutase family protein [Planctomycetes bacterium]|nr:superoxide dismutase family protein [Planctomycetota bacterium]